jgi:glycosyltransferase involved in cell wall biosynthesis
MNAPANDPDGCVVVIPCYNAGDRLARVVDAARQHAGGVYVVDDGSTDAAPGHLTNAGVTLLRHGRNLGKGHALLTGFRAALEQTDSACVAVLDADGQHDPAQLPALRDAFHEERADLLIGARAFALGQVPLRSWVGNTATRLLTAALVGVRLPDTQSGYRLHSRRLLEGVLRRVAPGRYETEMEILVYAVRAGFTVASRPVATLYEAGNASSHFHALRDSWLVYRRLAGAAIRHRQSTKF